MWCVWREFEFSQKRTSQLSHYAACQRQIEMSGFWVLDLSVLEAHSVEGKRRNGQGTCISRLVASSTYTSSVHAGARASNHACSLPSI
jgi:hypothetical protein